MFLKTDGEPRDSRVAESVLKPYGFARKHQDVDTDVAAFNAKVVDDVAAYANALMLTDQIEREDGRETKKEMKARLRSLHTAIFNPRK